MVTEDGETGPPAEDREDISASSQNAVPFRQENFIMGGKMNIYVGNLSFEMTADELRNEFAQFGAVLSVTMMDDKYIGSGQPRAYGYVEMASKSEGTAAIASLAGRTIHDQIISVVEALPLTDKVGTVTTTQTNPFKRIGERKRQTLD